MLLLTLFAFVAGAGTALSPCSLPVLPALLSASAAGGRRRPLGIVVGLAITFCLTIVGLASVVDGVGLGDGAIRDVAIIVLAGFGLAVLIPPLAHALERPLYALSARGVRSGGDGFVSGLGVGAALGLVHAPCAGPILAAVIAVSAASGSTVVLGIAFSLGTALVLFGIAIGGRSLVKRVAGGVRGARLQQAVGGVMLLTAVLMAFSVDVRFQQAVADDLPGFLINPTRPLEDSGAVKDRLADLQGAPRFSPTKQVAAAKLPPLTSEPGRTLARPSDLPVLGRAPEFTGTQKWFNGPAETIAGNVAAGRVTLIDFWTYTCINCLRTLPALRGWDDRYRAEGLSIVGVHSPEFSFEKDAGNVASAIKRLGIVYPVVQDNDLATWGAWGNQYWPAKYLIDAKGDVRYVHFGEGDDDETEAAIRSLLAESGATLGAKASGRAEEPVAGLATPETYLGAERAEGFTTAPVEGTRAYSMPGGLQESQFALGGRWEVSEQAAQAVGDAEIAARFTAAKAYLVLSPPSASRAGTVRVTLDGRVIKTVRVARQQLYTLVDLPKAGTHDLRLDVSDGTSAYAFTFG